MEKTSKYINLLTILVGLAVAVLAYLLISAVDQLRQDTSAKETELEAALAALTKTEEKSAGDKAALMATKAGLTDDLEDHRGQTARLNLELPENEAKLESLKKQQEEARAEERSTLSHFLCKLLVVSFPVPQYANTAEGSALDQAVALVEVVAVKIQQ